MMRSDKWSGTLCSTGLLAALLGMPPLVQAQDRPQAKPASTSDQPLGVDVFGGGGISFPSAKDSFEAVGLGSTAFDFGGGARVTGLWRGMFLQGAVARWSDTGERAFVASDGTVFKLGIPLDVSATYLDATLGVKNAVRTSAGRISYLHYVGAGAGVVQFKESSPFAEPGDDLDTTKPSYHVLAGVEVPIASWVAVAIDGRYRYIPGILGDDGVSGILEEESLGGFQAAVGLRLGFGGPKRIVPPPTRTSPTRGTPLPSSPGVDRLPTGVITEAAPVFIMPDTARTPLRILAAGTNVRILEEKEDWIRVEFTDPQFGRRIGYVQRRFVQRQTP